LRNILSLFPVPEQPGSEPEDRLLMTVDEHAKVVRLSSKHAPHYLSIVDVHVLRSRGSSGVVRLFIPLKWTKVPCFCGFLVIRAILENVSPLIRRIKRENGGSVRYMSERLALAISSRGREPFRSSIEYRLGTHFGTAVGFDNEMPLAL
jgi:hypothetical protein